MQEIILIPVMRLPLAVTSKSVTQSTVKTKSGFDGVLSQLTTRLSL